MKPFSAWWQNIEASEFEWFVPDQFNIASACFEDADLDAVALFERGGSRDVELNFGELRDKSRHLANWLLDRGLSKGDRIAVFLPQCWELVVAHAAAYYAGLVVVPLTTKFASDAVEYRLADSGASVIIGRNDDLTRVSIAIDGLSSLKYVIATDGVSLTDSMELDRILAENVNDKRRLGDTAAEDPAIIIYTSGTTSKPKGTLHAHRVLIGHMPGVRVTHEGFPHVDDLMWTPAEWAWIGGIFDVLFPSLACGIPVVASDAQVSPSLCRYMLEQVGVRNTFIPPTMLKQMRSTNVKPRENKLRTLTCGGESLGDELHAWVQQQLNISANEFYGQTEMNMTLGQRRNEWIPPKGSMGRAIPGFEIAILKPNGTIASANENGEISVRTPNPGQFLRYWNKPEQTENKYSDRWLRTGDIGRMDGNGNVFFEGRSDDVILSSGYRIGPGEIEECLLSHPAVALVAVIGSPDDIRGEIVVAHVVVNEGVSRSDKLKQELMDHVKYSLAFYQYPRRIEFHDELPMTTTGKIQRRLLKE